MFLSVSSVNTISLREPTRLVVPERSSRIFRREIWNVINISVALFREWNEARKKDKKRNAKGQENDEFPTSSSEKCSFNDAILTTIQLIN